MVFKASNWWRNTSRWWVRETCCFIVVRSRKNWRCPGSFPHRMAKERLCERDAIRGRGDPSRTSTNREAKSSTGLAREWKRRGRIRHLRAKPAGIWAKASKKKRGDREVESTINAWGLLLSGQKATDRNRRVSSPLSPIYYLFLSPSGKLYQKVQHLLAEEERAEGSPPPVVIK